MEKSSKNRWINWAHISNIFTDDFDAVFRKPVKESYCDREVDAIKDDESAKKMLVKTFKSMKKFEPTETDVETKSTSEEAPALVRTWKNKTETLQYWYINAGYSHGYAIIYENTKTFLIVGCYGSHPFVCTPKFEFVNSDGSTNDKCKFDASLETIVADAQKNTLEYLFNQSH